MSARHPPPGRGTHTERSPHASASGPGFLSATCTPPSQPGGRRPGEHSSAKAAGIPPIQVSAWRQKREQQPLRPWNFSSCDGHSVLDEKAPHVAAQEQRHPKAGSTAMAGGTILLKMETARLLAIPLELHCKRLHVICSRACYTSFPNTARFSKQNHSERVNRGGKWNNTSQQMSHLRQERMWPEAGPLGAQPGPLLRGRLRP